MGLLDDLKRITLSWENIPTGRRVVAVNESKESIESFDVDLHYSEWVDDEGGNVYRRDEGWELYTTKEIPVELAPSDIYYIAWYDNEEEKTRLAHRVGHRDNGVWSFNERQIDEKELRNIIGSETIRHLRVV